MNKQNEALSSQRRVLGRTTAMLLTAAMIIGTGLFAAYGILAAYIHRQHTGEGQFLDMALLDCAVAFSIIG